MIIPSSSYLSKHTGEYLLGGNAFVIILLYRVYYKDVAAFFRFFRVFFPFFPIVHCSAAHVAGLEDYASQGSQFLWFSWRTIMGASSVETISCVTKPSAK